MVLVQFFTEKNSYHHILTEGEDPALTSDFACKQLIHTCIPVYEHLICRKAYSYAYFSESGDKSLKDRCFHWTEKKTIPLF